MTHKERAVKLCHQAYLHQNPRRFAQGCKSCVKALAALRQVEIETLQWARRANSPVQSITLDTAIDQRLAALRRDEEKK